MVPIGISIAQALIHLPKETHSLLRGFNNRALFRPAGLALSRLVTAVLHQRYTKTPSTCVRDENNNSTLDFLFAKVCSHAHAPIILLLRSPTLYILRARNTVYWSHQMCRSRRRAGASCRPSAGTCSARTAYATWTSAPPAAARCSPATAMKSTCDACSITDPTYSRDISISSACDTSFFLNKKLWTISNKLLF